MLACAQKGGRTVEDGGEEGECVEGGGVEGQATVGQVHGTVGGTTTAVGYTGSKIQDLFTVVQRKWFMILNEFVHAFPIFVLQYITNLFV